MKRCEMLLVLAWVNFGFQVAVAVLWGLGVGDLIAARWGDFAATLILGGCCLVPSSALAAAFYREYRRWLK